MSTYLSLWMHVGCLSLVLVAVGTMECTERESLIRQISIVETTQCLMDCTVLTFAKIMELGDNRSIRMKDSSQEEQRNHTDYCWPLDLKCTAGEHLQQAFVIMPVDQYVVTHVDLTVNGIGPVEGTLNAHEGPTMLPDDCGLRYDVTSVYQSTPRESQGVGSDFCVQVFPRKPLSREGMLKCFPFLVTVWQKGDLADQSKLEGGG
ncbi:uncharacterized protein LOC130381197 [Gadus chalcogrammus]|uniref:uncharacterized protein LOC130381197 n=1 Tax=Gadus chalcogrammus TaxID=1042646 RepID=UPI0024C225D6|nr:uncharacterized protein LOC130381197 [Gadus chalcogrammus]